EARFYGEVAAPWLPEFLGWDDDEEEPMLALEDLSGAHWPPPWRTERVERVMATLRELAGTRPPNYLPSLAAEKGRYSGWPVVAADPVPFLALKHCSARWLAAALPALLASEAEAEFGGDGLVHLDVRSDNL